MPISGPDHNLSEKQTQIEPKDSPNLSCVLHFKAWTYNDICSSKHKTNHGVKWKYNILNDA